MKILFLVDPRLNYVSDPLYIGLLRALGEDSVIDYPWKAAFHDPAAKLWFLPQVAGRAYSEEEIRTLLADKFFDLVCVASPRPESLTALKRLYTPDFFPPIVFIDSADDSNIRHDVVSRFPIRVYFKREYAWGMGSRLWDYWTLARIFRGGRKLFARTVPFPFSLVMDTLPGFGSVVKEIDVSYRGHASHPPRVKAVKILCEMSGVRFSGGVYAGPSDRKYKLKAGALKRLWTKIVDDSPASQVDQQLKQAPKEYYQEIATSRIAVSIRGGGWMTPRYFEIVGMGTMLVSERPEILIPDDFVDRRHAVFCKPDLSDLETLVRYYLRHDEEREAIAAEGRAHLLKYHTCERRAEYFLDVCTQLI